MLHLPFKKTLFAIGLDTWQDRWQDYWQDYLRRLELNFNYWSRRIAFPMSAQNLSDESSDLTAGSQPGDSSGREDHPKLSQRSTLIVNHLEWSSGIIVWSSSANRCVDLWTVQINEDSSLKTLRWRETINHAELRSSCEVSSGCIAINCLPITGQSREQ